MGYHSNESCGAVSLCGTVYYDVYKVLTTQKPVDKLLLCDYSNASCEKFFFSGGTVHHAVNKVVRTQKSKRVSSQMKAEHVEQRFLVVLQSDSEISIKVCR